jgi:hypothetical protein
MIWNGGGRRRHERRGLNQRIWICYPYLLPDHSLVEEQWDTAIALKETSMALVERMMEISVKRR